MPCSGTPVSAAGRGDKTASRTGRGAGIPADFLPHLFDRYYQSRNSVAPATGEGGKGLGLAIVKRILEDHGGELVLTDAVQAPGARAILRLPAMKTARQTQTEGASAA